MPTRILIAGPVRSGKSTIAASLYRLLREEGVRVGLWEIDVYSDTHDCILGRKPWEARKKRKHAWYFPTIHRRIEEFRNDPNDIVLGDLPGKITNQFLPHMVAPGDGALIIAKDMAGLAEWSRFLVERRVPVIAKIVSYLETPPTFGVNGYILAGGLDRIVRRTPDIRQIARVIQGAARNGCVAVAH